MARSVGARATGSDASACASRAASSTMRWRATRIARFTALGVTFVPLTKRASTGANGDQPVETTPRERQKEREELLRSFRHFDASHASCANPEDLDRLLGIVETACGSLEAFSQIVRDTFEPKAKESFRAYACASRKRAGSSVSAGSGGATPRGGRRPGHACGGGVLAPQTEEEEDHVV